jgi:acyl-CoA synthetase (AMP-forming)/AMP-acid ligase II
VALLLPSTPLYLVAYLAAARLGAITTGINVRYRRTEIGHILRQSGAKLLLAVTTWHDADFRATVEPLRPELPDLREVVWLEPDAIRAGTRGVVRDLAAEPPAGGPTPDDPLAIVFTSGTTGAPKGAWYTHRNALALVAIESRRHANGLPRFQKHLGAGLSFAHVGTMARIGIQIAGMGCSILHDAYDTVRVLETIAAERLEHLGAFPTQAIMLLDHPDRTRYDLSSLKSVLLGGAPGTRPHPPRAGETLGVTVPSATRRPRRHRDGLLPTIRSEILRRPSARRLEGVESRVVDAERRFLPPARSARSRSAAGDDARLLAESGGDRPDRRRGGRCTPATSAGSTSAGYSISVDAERDVHPRRLTTFIRRRW